MGELRSTLPRLHLDLNNFDSVDAQRSRFVLTSPRSLQSCARLGVKPVELLIKSLNELSAEQRHVPSEVVRVMHESYETERKKRLQMCREERGRLIQEAGSRWSGPSSGASGLQEVPETKGKEYSREVPYADLCFKEKPVSRLSCSTACIRQPGRRTGCSFSLGDLRCSPATEMKLEELTKDINKKMCVTVSERDCKIAALMLVKHEEKQESMRLCQQEELKRQEARRHEEAQQAQAENERRRKLKKNMQHWHEMLRARRRLKEEWEEVKVRQLEKEVQMQEHRWRRLKEEVEAQRREKIESNQKEAGWRKRCQEELLRKKEEVERGRREKERQVAAEREHRAQRSKVSQEQKKKKRLEEGNHQELLRHVLLKKHKEQQQEEEEAQRKSTLEKRLQLSCVKQAQNVEARLREQQDRTARDQEQTQRAQLRAELQEVQQLKHKQILVQLSQRRRERAALHVSAQQLTRSLQTLEHNTHRLLSHRTLREGQQREEEAMRIFREGRISMKEWRRERLRRHREQIQEEAFRRARASFHMRERVRQQTHRRTFDQMVLEAQLVASMRCMKV